MQRTVVYSDLSETEIEDGKAGKIVVHFSDRRRGTYELDVTDEEAEEYAGKGRKLARGSES